MKTPPRPAFLIGAALLCVSCARPAIAPSDSLVTRDPLPSSKQLSRESILIVRDIGETLRTLRYTLGPDDVLEIELVTRDNPNVSYRIETARSAKPSTFPPPPRARPAKRSGAFARQSF